MVDQIRVLILGVTAYIGGSILAEFLQHRGTTNEEKYEITALVRKFEQAEKLGEIGVCAILFKDLDDNSRILDIAKQNDVVIAAASARHEGCAKAYIVGLNERKLQTGRDVSGASMLGDWPISGERIDTKIYSDVTDDIYSIERDFPEQYSPVRKVNQLVVGLGEERGDFKPEDLQ
ncbi:hypothetical protein NHQ30_007368 [Ciborinia camelliae]|nr:hypothetical protein NHQ30_007368 [Ciborinia camelliae]